MTASAASALSPRRGLLIRRGLAVTMTLLVALSQPLDLSVLQIGFLLPGYVLLGEEAWPILRSIVAPFPKALKPRFDTVVPGFIAAFLLGLI